MSIFIFILFCVLAVVLIKLLLKPIGWALKLLAHAVIGFIGLFFLNFFGSVIGIGLELSWLNALVAGLFGLPGVVVLLLLQYFG